MEIKRTAAILLTAATAATCGFPGLVLMCMGNLKILSSQAPGSLSSVAISDLIISAIYLAIGLALFVIPVATGLISLTLANGNEKGALC